MPFISWNSYTQKNVNILTKILIHDQITVCLEQQIYTSPEHFTQTLFVMFVTYRRSATELVLCALPSTYVSGRKIRNSSSLGKFWKD